MATAQPSRAAARAGFWWTGVGVFVLWNAMVLAGALAGDLLGDPRAWGLDAAAAAAFLGLLWPRLGTRTARVVVLLAVVVAAVLVPLAPPGVPVLAAAAVAVVAAQVLPGGPPPSAATEGGAA
ncbi:hypothetical protein GCM10025865_31980 [Paraoerskovia sediminicola]|uniref:Uncharacterized protein n=1 Tax=Paraoerskovia sediminicola TaxID=1138587 RepID=A0ABN6XGF3_9CELL|nr:hypothetical protein GCM10025865_31980 [Paraoerskovia sediminicola]